MGIVNKKILVTITCMLVLIEISSLFLMYKSSANKNTQLDSVSLKQELNSPEMFAIMLEQSDGTYKESTSSDWPTDMTYNTEMSGCIDSNGNKLDGILSFDSSTKIATVETGNTAYCYLYFDKMAGAYAIYSSDDTSLTFYKNKDEVAGGDTYNGKTVTAVYTGIETSEYSNDTNVPWYDYRETITTVEVAEEIQPISTANWFNYFRNTTKFDIEKLDTSQVTNMSYMFANVGQNVETFELDLSNWDTSQVTNMVGMFSAAGEYATNWSVGDISNWDVSNVTDMFCLFFRAGVATTTWSIGDLSSWDTSQVTNMAGMFAGTGMSATSWSVGDISNWDTSQVITMDNMFEAIGYSALNFELDLSGWDTSQVMSMYRMFRAAGYSATSWSVGNLSNWDVSQVRNMESMFHEVGCNAKTFELDLSGWDTTNVANMYRMFYYAGFNAQTFKLNLSNWDTSNVKNMSEMFTPAGYYAESFELNLLNWDTSSVTDMTAMFYDTGRHATYILDLSKWNVPNVTNYDGFNTNVESKVIAPTWVN